MLAIMSLVNMELKWNGVNCPATEILNVANLDLGTLKSQRQKVKLIEGQIRNQTKVEYNTSSPAVLK